MRLSLFPFQQSKQAKQPTKIHGQRPRAGDTLDRPRAQLEAWFHMAEEKKDGEQGIKAVRSTQRNKRPQLVNTSFPVAKETTPRNGKRSQKKRRRMQHSATGNHTYTASFGQQNEPGLDKDFGGC